MAESLDFQLDKSSNSDEESQSSQATRISTLFETLQPSISDNLHFDSLKQRIDNEQKEPSKSIMLEMLDVLKLEDSIKSDEQTQKLIISNLLSQINTLKEYINNLLQILKRECQHAQNKKPDYKLFEAPSKCESKQPSKFNIILKLLDSLKNAYEYNDTSHKLLKSNFC